MYLLHQPQALQPAESGLQLFYRRGLRQEAAGEERYPWDH